MNWIGGGLVVVVYYSGGSAAVVGLQNPILTESNLDLLAENSNFLEVETA